ncbi:rnhA [Canna indica]|uniref:RnhA n=1 Tax=Canna indica TaxID=4628 RepID=A0AAQ3QEC8_9LILI|nr:rnhA [Canna indica]
MNTEDIHYPPQHLYGNKNLTGLGQAQAHQTDDIMVSEALCVQRRILVERSHQGPNVGRLHRRVHKRWTLFVDDASDKRESGAGIIIENDQGIALKQSLQFELKANNNQAEYEAMAAGLKPARDMKAQILTVKSDSQLVVGQVNDNCQARDPSLERYLSPSTFFNDQL